MVKEISIHDFFEIRKSLSYIDVRSPVEFDKGHIPGSMNIPLFSNEERAVIGTAYKKKGPAEAVKIGESFAEPRVGTYLREFEKHSVKRKVILFCLRGGMRSRRIAHLLSESGFDIYRLERGYKNYRAFVQSSFKRTYPLSVLGGKTGSGKTEILQELKDSGEQVIDLEGLSNHRGSAFGGIGMKNQPSTEQFENDLFEKMSLFNMNKRIWVEDESLNIGHVFIPKPFYEQMKCSPLIILNMDTDFRLERLCRDYSAEGRDPLKKGILKIQKRLGQERALEAINAIDSGNLKKAASIVLGYYDKCYSYGLTKKTNSTIDYVQVDTDNPARIAKILLGF